jgi:hypothetical protein
VPVVVADDEARAVVVNRPKRRACSVMADYSVNQRAVMVRMWWPISCFGNQWRSRLFRGASPVWWSPIDSRRGAPFFLDDGTIRRVPDIPADESCVGASSRAVMALALLASSGCDIAFRCILDFGIVVVLQAFTACCL